METPKTDTINSLELLNTYTTDAKARNEKYQKRIDDGRRGLANKLRHAIQEISCRGKYLIRINSAYTKVYTIAFYNTNFHVSIISKHNSSIILDDLEYSEMIRLSDIFTNCEYFLLSPDQDELYSTYLRDVFPEDDKALSLLERQVDKQRDSFNNNLKGLLINLRKLGLCLKFKPFWGNNQNCIVAFGGLNDFSFYGENRSSVNPNANSIAELRKLIRANEVVVVPFDQAFNK